jgi:pleiotropic regulator 1
MSAPDIANGSTSTATSSLLIPCIKSLKRTYELFSTYGNRVPDDLESQRLKLYSKVRDEYELIKDLPAVMPSRTSAAPPPVPSSSSTEIAIVEHKEKSVAMVQPISDTMIVAHVETDGYDDNEEPKIVGGHAYPSRPGVSLSEETATSSGVQDHSINKLLQTLPNKREEERKKTSYGLVEYRQAAGIGERINPPTSSALMNLTPLQFTKPEWHAPWKLMRVISGHTGWVRSIAVDPSNEWFATGSGDRTVKIWDLASGTLKLTLTGHIEAIRGLAISDRHPYLFSAGEDKMIKCWDLEYNKVIRQYHGHLSAVYSLALHPTIDVLVTGGRDSTARVWDIRSKQCVHVLSGHTNTVCALSAQALDPQIISGSHDSTVKLWDLAAGRCSATLTNHKKSVRALVIHPQEFTFASGAPDNIKQWACPEGRFLKNLSGHNAIVNSLALSPDNVLVSAADNGTMCFWDWKTGYNFQQLTTTPQPGSLDSEAGIYALCFDKTGARLITAEADKSVKIWKEDETATEETHPITNWRPRNKKRF